MKQKFIFIIVLILLALVVIFYVFKSRIKDYKINLQKIISEIKEEYVFAEVLINDIQKDSIDFSIKFIDIESNMVTNLRFNLKGTTFFIESKIVLIDIYGKKKPFVFPLKVYTDKIIEKEGILLYNEYEKFLNLYKNIKEKNVKKFVEYLIENDFKTERFFGLLKNVKEYNVALYNHNISKIYKKDVFMCILHSNGSVELRLK